MLRPLERRGMAPGQRVVDLASGDGQLSAALALRGHRNLTLWDLDPERLDMATRVVRALVRELRGEDFAPGKVRASATEFEGPFDVLTCYQTVEHLSDRGNYAVASRSCQREFLRRVDASVRQLAYFNAPNLLYPWDGHDTGLFGFHWLPISWRHALIERGWVSCSWSGVAQPVTVGFLKRRLPSFRLDSRYHAHDGVMEYLRDPAPYDYLGREVQPVDLDRLPWRWRGIRLVSRVLGQAGQNCLPVLSLVFAKRGR